MFYTEAERGIYTAPDGRKFDPLRVLHLLVVHTKSRLTELVTLRNPDTLNSGDVSASGRAQARVAAAQAELELADAARVVFEFGPFGEEDGGMWVTDAEVLETLFHFTAYLEGKGAQAPTPRPSEVSVREVSESTPTTNS